MKKIMSLLLAAVVACVLGACTSGGASSAEGAEGSENAQMKNPMHSWNQEEFAQQCAELKLPVIAAPENAQEAAYFTYDNDLAEIQFKIDDQPYAYRAASGVENISGLYVEFEDEAGTVMIGGGEAQVKTIKGGGAVVLWSRDGVDFSLFSEKADASQLSAVASGLGGMKAVQAK